MLNYFDICGHFQSFHRWAIRDKSLRSEDFPMYETLHRIGQRSYIYPLTSSIVCTIMKMLTIIDGTWWILIKLKEICQFMYHELLANHV